MHVTNFDGALAMLLTILVAQTLAGVSASTFQDCTDCKISCQVPAKIVDEGKLRSQCYGNANDVIKPFAKPKGWKLSWTDEGDSDPSGYTWRHNRTVSISGISTSGGQFDHRETRGGMATSVTCKVCK